MSAIAYVSGAVATADHRAAVLRAARRAWPMALGYVPIAFAFCVFAVGQGLSPLNAVLMSVLVYATSSQFAAVNLLAVGAPVASVVATVFVINMRHLLMSSVLAPRLRHFKRWQVPVFAFQLCDEAFALHSLSEGPLPWLETFVVNASLYLGWLIGTFAALLLQATPQQQLALGLDYAPVAMFVALLVLLVRNRLHLAVALLGGALSVLLRQRGLQGWDIIVATAISATVGAVGYQWINKKSSSPSLV